LNNKKFIFHWSVYLTKEKAYLRFAYELVIQFSIFETLFIVSKENTTDFYLKKKNIKILLK
jgi:hypothetical protein